MKKLTLVDYIIIILVIAAVVFAFIHLTSDNSSDVKKNAFDASTINKISDTYSNYYKDGYIVKTTVKGFNATNGERLTLNGTITWIGDNGGSDVRILVESQGQTYLCGLYKTIPNADIYIDTISLESDGSKYDNLVEMKVKPENINSLKDLTKNVSDNTNYEISTELGSNSLNPEKLQEIQNKINTHDKRSCFKVINNNLGNQIVITKATPQDINDANSVLGNINGATDTITIRIYDCNESVLNSIKNSYEVENIRNF